MENTNNPVTNALAKALNGTSSHLNAYLEEVETEEFREDLRALLDAARSPCEAAIKERIIEAIRNS